MTRGLLLAVSALAIAGVSSTTARPAYADESKDEAADRAEQLAGEAYQRFEAGQYAEAIELYRQSYAAAPSARTLYNIATIYDERLHEPELAKEYFRRYANEPDAETDLAEQAAARVAALEAPPAVPSPPATVALSPAPPPPLSSPRPEERPLRPWGFVSIGVGVASLVTGTVFGLVAKSKNDDAVASCTGDACTDPRAITLTNDASSAARVADVAFAAGAVLTAAGIVLVLWAPRAPGANVRVTSTLGGVGVSGSWR